MADIQFEVDSIDAVDEELKEAYVEKDGKFRFDPDKYHELRAKPLIAKNKELIGKNKTLSESVQSLEKVKQNAGSDADRIAAEKDQKITALQNELRETKIWMPVQQLAVKHGVIPSMLEPFMKVLRADKRFDLDDDGNLTFIDKNGDQTVTKPQRAFEIYLREEMPGFFEASKAAGSGAKNGAKGGGGRTISRETFEAMSATDKQAVIREGARVLD